MRRVLVLLMRDVEARLATLTAPEPPADGEWLALLRTSVVIGSLERWGRWCGALASRSTLLTLVATWRSRWTGRHWTEQRLTTGVALLTATLVHVGLARWEGSQAGWLWLVLPAMAGSVSLLLMAASRAPEPQ